MQSQFVWLSLVGAVIALLYALWKSRWINKQNPGNEKMQEIGRAVGETATACLTRE